MSDGPAPPLIVIAGPTGSGKSELAVRLAEVRGGEIVNYDSVQIYRGFDIGSAKPDPATRRRVPHHLFDIVDADEEFNAADFATMAGTVCGEIQQRGATPILTGGTFFYLRALLTGLPEMPARDEELRARIRAIAARPRGPHLLHRYLGRIDPASAARIAAADRHRVERALEVWISSGRPISSYERVTAASGDTIPAIKLALRVDRAALNERVARRVEAMFAGGLIDETRQLLERYPPSARPFATIGYKEAVGVIQGQLAPGDAIAETIRRTRAYAKRQMTWLRSEQNVHWIDAPDPDTAFANSMQMIEVNA